MFSHYFLKARLDYYSSRLGRLPTGSIGYNKSKNAQVVRLRFKTKDGIKRREFYVSSAKGVRALSVLEERKKLKELHEKYGLMLNKISGDMFGIGNGYIQKINNISLFRGSFFQEAKQKIKSEDEKNFKDFPYSFDGIKMRSRAEVLIAEVLKSKDMEFLYEPELVIGEITYHPDFLVYIPELDCCILIEFLGMMDNQIYTGRNIGKITAYTEYGIKPGIDIIYLMGSEKYIPDPLYISGAIDSLLEYLSSVLSHNLAS